MFFGCLFIYFLPLNVIERNHATVTVSYKRVTMQQRYLILFKVQFWLILSCKLLMKFMPIRSKQILLNDYLYWTIYTVSKTARETLVDSVWSYHALTGGALLFLEILTPIMKPSCEKINKIKNMQKQVSITVVIGLRFNSTSFKLGGFRIKLASLVSLFNTCTNWYNIMLCAY